MSFAERAFGVFDGRRSPAGPPGACAPSSQERGTRWLGASGGGGPGRGGGDALSPLSVPLCQADPATGGVPGELPFTPSSLRPKRSPLL